MIQPPMYGHGLTEARTGQAKRRKNRDDFLMASKVGHLLKLARRADIDFVPWVNAAPLTTHFYYSYDGTMRSVEDSLQRLALEHIDIMFIHDVDVFTRGAEQPEVFKQAMDGCYHALASLREQGVLKVIRVGVNEWQVCLEALKQLDFDAFLPAGRCTLLEQEALNDFLPPCEARGVAVLVGGGFNSGILATGTKPGAKYNCAPDPADVMEKVARNEVVCAAHNPAMSSSCSKILPGSATRFRQSSGLT